MSVVNPGPGHRSALSTTSQRQSQIPFLAKSGHVLPGDLFSRVVESSAPGAWSDLVVEQHRCPATELRELAYQQHVVVLNIGDSLVCEYKHGGRWKSARKSVGAVSLFPSGHTFNRRMRSTAEVVYLALDPMFFLRNASEDIPPQPEFAERRQSIDPVLFHFARMLRHASSTELRYDLLFGSSVALSLARHLLLSYRSQSSSSVIGATEAMSAKVLKEAKDFIEAHLQSGMAVGQIAHSVRMSSSHFTRTFKNATGRSPYRYVMELRLSRAKEMLLRSRCSLKEVTYALGFADQSHLTREFRRAFGMTPKVLLEQTTLAHQSVFDRRVDAATS